MSTSRSTCCRSGGWSGLWHLSTSDSTTTTSDSWVYRVWHVRSTLRYRSSKSTCTAAVWYIRACRVIQIERRCRIIRSTCSGTRFYDTVLHRYSPEAFSFQPKKNSNWISIIQSTLTRVISLKLFRAKGWWHQLPTNDKLYQKISLALNLHQYVTLLGWVVTYWMCL